MISVVVPVYNVEKHLNKCVESILSQSYVDIEIILVDDGSTDSSPELCDNLEKKYPDKIKVIHKINEGVSVARNLGIVTANGEWIAFVDADDVIENTMFESYIQVLRKYDGCVDLLVGGYKIINADGIVVGEYGPTHTSKWQREEVGELFRSVSKKLDERGWLCYFVWNRLYRRDIIIGNNIRYKKGLTHGEDFLFNVNYFKFVNNVVTIKGCPYHYWKHNIGTATSKFGGDSDFLFRRQMYFEASQELYKNLEIYEEQKVDLERIEAQQIYATANWIFAENCPFSFQKKLIIVKKIIEEYRYGYLIKKYSMKNVGMLKKLQVKMLMQKNYTAFIIYGSMLRKIQLGKDKLKTVIRKRTCRYKGDKNGDISDK